MHQITMYRIREVCEVTGLKPSTIYKLIRSQDFPKGIRLTKRSTAWSSDAVNDWLQTKLEASK
jgi:prophage regulatory protein